MRELWGGSDPHIYSGEVAFPMHRMQEGSQDSEYMKMRVTRERVLSMDGVETVWEWRCPHNGCFYLGTHYNYSVYFETALRGALHHIEWHRSFDAPV